MDGNHRRGPKWREHHNPAEDRSKSNTWAIGANLFHVKQICAAAVRERSRPPGDTYIQGNLWLHRMKVSRIMSSPSEFAHGCAQGR